MRPIANFTLHAMLAAALTALAATSAAAGRTGGKEEVYYTITLTDARAHQGSKGEQLEVQSWSWGGAQAGVTKVDSFTVKQGVKPVGTSDVTMKRGTGPAPVAGGVQVAVGDVTGDGSAGPGASQSMTVGGAQTEASGPPTGKRQHKPMTLTKPLDRGSVNVKVKFPWAACRVGAHYPSLELGGGAERYVLQDVTVSGCGGSGGTSEGPEESITFVYGKLGVRGWDPKKKEQ